MLGTNFNLLLLAINEVLELLLRGSEMRREALTAISKAFIETYHFLKENNNEPQKNILLAHLWNEAAISVEPIDQNLAHRLQIKSRFFMDPDLFSDYRRKNELIQIRQVVDEMERIKLKFPTGLIK